MADETLAFFGSSQESAALLTSLLEANKKLAFVVTQPDRKQGRHLASQPTLVKKIAAAAGLPVYSPESLKGDLQGELAAILQPKVDFFIVVAYGKILPPLVYQHPKQATINVHFSLLPRWRGASPMQHSLLMGDQRTGVSIMQIEKGLDTGPVFYQEEYPLGETTTYGELSEKLTELAKGALLYTLEHFAKLRPEPQDPTKATVCGVIEKEAGLIDWQQDAISIDRQFRAFFPKPGVYSFWRGKRVLFKALRLCKEDPSLLDPDFQARFQTAQAGELLPLDKNRKEFLVACQTGWVIVSKLVVEGKNETSGDAFLRGYKVQAGERFAS